MKRLPLVLLILLCSCSTQIPPAQRTHIYNHSFDAVFDATIQFLQSHGITIANADRSTGFINTNPGVSDIPHGQGLMFNDNPVRYSFTVSKINATKTSVFVQATMQIRGSYPLTDKSSLELYSFVFSNIGELLSQAKETPAR